MRKFLLLVLFLYTLNASTVSFDYSDVNIKNFELSYLQDKNSSLTLKQVQKMKFDTRNSMHSFNGKSGTIWYKLKLNNQTSLDKEIFIHDNLAYFLKTVEISEFYHTKLIDKNIYNILEDASSNRLIGSTLVHKVTVKADDSLTLYIKTIPMISNYADFAIYDAKSSIKALMNKDSCSILIIAIMFTLAFYNATLYLFNRRKEFLFYAAYMIVPTIGLTYKYGVIFSQWHLYGVATYYINLTAIIMPAFLLLFIKHLLKTKKLNIKIDHTLNLFIILILLDTLLGLFVDLSLALDIFKILFMLSAAFIIYIIRYLFKTSHPLAPIFSIAYGFYITGMIITIFAMSNVIDLTYFTFRSGGIGLIMEGLLFSYLMHYNVKILEQEIRKQKEIILTKNKKAQLGGMINAITHQWKQPLSRITSITAFLEFKLMQKEKISLEEFSNKVMQINSSTQFLSDTIDDFKDFFNPDATKEMCDVAELLTNAITLSSDDTLTKEITINQSLSFPTPLNIYKNQLLHIVLNLLQNAKEAFAHSQEAHKIIKVFGKIVDDKIQIDILDNAGGIDEDKLPYIFNENFSTKKEKSGNGLGLYITKTILQERLHGSIEVKNTNDGTMFRITI